MNHFLESRRWRMLVGGAAAALAGLALLHVFANASFDLQWRFVSRGVTNQVVLIEMDKAAYGELHQTRGLPWDRALHAQLLDYLRKDGCPLVVFDIWFDDEPQPKSDAALAEAMRQHGKVVLMATLADPSHPRIAGNQVFLPALRFRNVTTNGIGQAGWESDGVVRRPWFGDEPDLHPSLPWVAAGLAGARLDPPSVAAREGRWLRYYGEKGAWKRLSYHWATNQEPDFFREKIVFIGNRPETSIAGDEPDEFRTPYTGRTGPAASGMEILATTFLNLVNRDWLRRLSWWQEGLILMALGAGLGAGLSALRWPTAAAAGLAAALVAFLAGVCLSRFVNGWFPWLVIAGGQIPVAVGWCGLTGYWRMRQVATQTRTVVVPLSRPVPETPGYERVKLLGEGAYGQVWLARSAVDEWHALKVILRSKFNDDGPYLREFNGIRRYTPVSRGHSGLLRVDFVSAQQPEEYFYYAMELGDAFTPGWESNPTVYKARDLSGVCQQAEKHRLPVAECVHIGLALADSVAFLHQHGFIHRDIKPSNVVFVQGRPKLADVGLVTEIRREGVDVSLLGTEGYIPPEGPGEPQGDIYSLGMLLYQISTGNRPTPHLDLSETLIEGAPEFILLNRVICKACAREPGDRHSSASELKAELEVIRNGIETRIAAGENKP